MFIQQTSLTVYWLLCLLVFLLMVRPSKVNECDPALCIFKPGGETFQEKITWRISFTLGYDYLSLGLAVSSCLVDLFLFLVSGYDRSY